MTTVYFRKIMVLAIIGLFIVSIVLPGISGSIASIDSCVIQSANLVKTDDVQLNFSEPQIKSVGRYAKVGIKEANYYNWIAGEPVIPICNFVMTYPLGTEIIDVKCNFHSVEKLELSRKILPAPEPVFAVNYMKTTQECFNENIYDSSELYPSKCHNFHTGGGLDGEEHVVFLSIHMYPIRYSPKLNVIEYAKYVDIEVSYKETSEGLFSTNQEDDFDLLIITPSEFNGSLQPLVEHKNSHGVAAKLVILEEINEEGRDKQEEIKYYIKDAIENWGVTYVLLVGNGSKMPVRYSYDANYSGVPDPFISDLYYADVYDANGTFCSWDTNMNNKFAETKHDHDIHKTIVLDKVDLYPDVNIGRLLCSNSSEVDIVVNKIIHYEENTAGKSWFNNLILFGGNDFPIGAELLLKLILESSYPDYEQHFAWEGEYLCDKVAELMVDFNAEKYYASAVIFKFLNVMRGVKTPTVENINEAINNGAGFLLLAAHGNPEGIVTYSPFFNLVPIPFPSGYTSSDVQKLNNGDKLPIMISEACSIGDFSGETGVSSPFAWEFVKLENGGAIASFASTSRLWVSPGSAYTESKGGYMVYHLFKAYCDGNDKAGTLLTKTITDYLNDDYALWEAYGDLYIHYGDIEMLSLFGDPSLKIGGYP